MIWHRTIIHRQMRPTEHKKLSRSQQTMPCSGCGECLRHPKQQCAMATCVRVNQCLKHLGDRWVSLPEVPSTLFICHTCRTCLTERKMIPFVVPGVHACYAFVDRQQQKSVVFSSPL